VDAKVVQKMSKFKFTCGLLQLSRCTSFLQFIIVLVKLSYSKNTVYLVVRVGSGIISKFMFMFIQQSRDIVKLNSNSTFDANGHLVKWRNYGGFQ
jgi:hypothetical protein